MMAIVKTMTMVTTNRSEGEEEEEGEENQQEMNGKIKGRDRMRIRRGTRIATIERANMRKVKGALFFLICVLLLQSQLVSSTTTSSSSSSSNQQAAVVEQQPETVVCVSNNEATEEEGDQQTCSEQKESEFESCGLYLGPSTTDETILGIFAGMDIGINDNNKDIKDKDKETTPLLLELREPFLPIIDYRYTYHHTKKNTIDYDEYDDDDDSDDETSLLSPSWRRWVWEGSNLDRERFRYESLHNLEIMIPGVGSHLACHPRWNNVESITIVEKAAAAAAAAAATNTTHDDPMKGSYTQPYYSYGLITTKPIRKGEELFLPCYDDYDDDDEDNDNDGDDEQQPQTESVLSSRMVCISNNIQTKMVASPIETTTATTKDDDDNNNSNSNSDDISSPVTDTKTEGGAVFSVSGGHRGAFAKRLLKTGETIAISPVTPLRQRDMNIYERTSVTPFWRGSAPTTNSNDDEDNNDNIGNSNIDNEEDDNQVQYTNSNIIGKQLLLNYCFGHADSDILLLPYASQVWSINHSNGNDNNKLPNVRIEWSTDERLLNDPTYLTMDPLALLLFSSSTQSSEEETEQQQTGSGHLVIQYVALRDIQPGEELLIDYGTQWQKALDQHIKTHPTTKATAAAAAAISENDNSYISAFEFYQTTPKEQRIRTLEEQRENPYPSNLQTVCYYQEDIDNLEVDNNNRRVTVEWDPREQSGDVCLRPCHILTSQQKIVSKDDESNKKYFYNVTMMPIPHADIPSHCHLLIHNNEDTQHVVYNIPSTAIRIVDKPYTSDQHQPNAFRHYIHVPENMYPQEWMKQQEEPAANFNQQHTLQRKDDLQPFTISPIQWKGSEEQVAKYAYEISLTEHITSTLLEYCNGIGITQAFRHFLLEGNPLAPNAKILTRFGGHNWQIHKSNELQSDSHWISPADEPAHDDYLRVLGKAKFDDALKAIGQQFGLEGISCYSVAFLGLSRSVGHDLVYDNVFRFLHGKAFRIAVPLLLANTSGAELEINDDENDGANGGAFYKYRYNTATIFGDNVRYGTRNCDYQNREEIRVMAIIQVADIQDPNYSQRLLKYSFQAYPSRKFPNHVYNRRHRHWHSTLKSKKLPSPLVVFDPLGERLNSGELLRMSWDEQQLHADMTFEIGLPDELQPTMSEYVRDMGLLDTFKDIFVGNELYNVDEREELRFRGYNWVVERPKSEWSTDEHLVAPGDETAHNNFLHMLAEGGFDEVIDGIGRHFSLKDLNVYQVALVGLSYTSRAHQHWKQEMSGNRVFQVLIPVHQPIGMGQNFEILQEKFDESYAAQYKFENCTAILFGYGTYYGTPACNYRNQKDFLVYVRIFIGVVNEDNIEPIADSLMQQFPSKDDTDFLLHAKHWNQSDDSLKLPRKPVKGDFLESTLQPGELAPLTWAGSDEQVDEYALRVGISEKLTKGLLEYCDQMGITETFREIVIQNKHLSPGDGKEIQLGNGENWYMQRPKGFWKSNIAWISPSDASAQLDYLKVVGRGGFDQVLESIGKRFNFDGLVAYHLTFIAVSVCERGYIHYDFTNTGGRAFNIIIPLLLANETNPELDIGEEGDDIGRYKYVLGEAIILGDDVNHATSVVNYTGPTGMRMAATIYVADINSDNIQGIMKYYTQKYPPEGDTEFLLSLAGSHWRKDSDKYKLPR